MKPTRRLKAVLGITAVLALLAGLAWFNESRITRMRRAEALVAHTHEVQTHLNRLLVGILSLAPTAVTELNQVCTLTGDNPAQQAKCSELQRQIPERLSQLESSALLMNRIRQTIEAMDAAEQSLLQPRLALAATEATAATLISLSRFALVLALLAGLFVLMRRESAARQQAQVESERFFSLSLDMLCIVKNGYFSRLNPAFSEVLGYSVEELTSTPFIDFVHEDDRPATLAQVEQLSRGIPTVNFHNRYRCRDGSWRWLSWKAQPVSGTALIYATARDVTQRREAQQLIETLNDQLQVKATWLSQANKELESFSYSVSHDLRAPLRSIDGFSQILLEENAEHLNEEGKDALTRVRRAAKEMGDLIDALLDLSRISRAELRSESVDLSGIAAAIVGELKTSQPARQTTITIRPEMVASGDSRLLRAMLGNLLGNAWKYSHPRDVTQIEFGSIDSEREIVYFVRDNGVGFDMAYVDKLFGAFQRLHRKSDFAGTGVGLATVQRIVHRHGGRVWAEGVVNQGATFFFTLGVSPKHQEAA